ncbi:MAG: BrnT family toxin [Magnetococcus sp. DMHC-1]
MKITYDPAKRDKTLAERGLDFEDALLVFAGQTHQFEDIRHDYGEQRMICYGILDGRLVVVGYVQRGETRHIFTMRKANEREKARYRERLGEG